MRSVSGLRLALLIGISFADAFLIPPLHSSANLGGRPIDRSTTVSRVKGKDDGDETRPPCLEESRPGPADTTEARIRALSDLFNQALATQNAKLVAKRYAHDAVLLPSSMADAIMDHEAIERYYESYLPDQPHIQILDGRIRVGHGWAEDAGICQVSSLNSPTKIKARYSFVYVWECNQWKILHHHTSSINVSEVQSPPASLGGPMNLKRVPNLFQLLQDAWEVGDADLVARRFHKDALLMPLEVYDSPKRGYAQIRVYFQEFLMDQPIISNLGRLQPEIDGSVHPKWAKDVGTFELTFRKSKNKPPINARYHVDYTLDDDGVWRIARFVLSPLPADWDHSQTWRGLPSPENRIEDLPSEAVTMLPTSRILNHQRRSMIPPSVTKDAVRGWFEEWNAAMATGEPEVVASRYTPEAVMITSLSGDTKTTPEEIRDFYQLFLWNRPQAKAIQSMITVSTHWCKDTGLLEYWMNQGTQRVRERYSFLYVYDEEAGWRIAYHHSAILHGYSIQGTGSGILLLADAGDGHFQ